MPAQANGDVGRLLELLGRSSTPPVKKNSFGLGFGNFLGEAMFPKMENASLLVASSQLKELWPKETPFVFGVPGLLEEQAHHENFSRLILYEEAFYSGPWLGADSGSQRHLAKELFEAGRIFRASGRAVLFVPSPTSGPKFDSSYLKSTCTGDLSNIPSEDLEEGAPQSDIWNFLSLLVEKRFDEKK